MINKDTWEYKYLNYILDIQNIISEGMSNMYKYKKCKKKYVNFDDVSNFIYYTSSKRISKFLDKADDSVYDLYFQYLIKRNRNNNI